MRLSQGTCATCHMNDYLDAGVPHDAAVEGGVHCTQSHTLPYRFPTDCAFCHTEQDWCDVPVQRVVDHHYSTFPLEGPHLPDSLTAPSTLEQCVNCHLAPPADPTQPDWVNRPRDCASCHAADRARADAKFCTKHPSFPNDCTSCHMSTSWSPAIPGLHPTGRFSVTGRSAHSGIACQDCHDLSRYPTDAGLLPTCLADGGVTPAYVPPFPNYSPCNINDTCPDCDCASCHSPAGNRRAHGDVLGDYNACVTVGRPSICWNCHYPENPVFQ